MNKYASVVHWNALSDQASSSIDFFLLSQFVETNESHSRREAIQRLQICHSCTQPTALLYMNHHTIDFFTVDLNTSVSSVRVNGYKNS